MKTAIMREKGEKKDYPISEEPTWEVCRKLVGCPIMSLLIFGRCLLNMEGVRVSKGSVWHILYFIVYT